MPVANYIWPVMVLTCVGPPGGLIVQFRLWSSDAGNDAKISVTVVLNDVR
jgi:hypothetical protein